MKERWPKHPLDWVFGGGPLRGQPKIVVDAGCWIWQGGKEKKGYGEVYFPQAEFPKMRMCRRHYGKKVPPGWCKSRAHQLTYFIKHGNIRAGLELGHTCMRRACCHWDHVTPVTLQENYSMKFYPPQLPSTTMREIERRIARDEPLQSIADDYTMSVWNARTIAEQMDWGRALRELTVSEADDTELEGLDEVTDGLPF